MGQVEKLHEFELIPVVELEPGTFSTKEHAIPSGTGFEMPQEWEHYWRASLADSGITGIDPFRPGSWLVSTADFSPSQLEKVLQVIVDDEGGISSLTGPNEVTALNGGIILSCEALDLLIEPTCCSDLGNFADWKEAASYSGADWEMLWIGHPWLSKRFQDPWLLLSDYHEGENPVERWAVKPQQLGNAVKAAEAELSRFAKEIASILERRSCPGDAIGIARKLLGLDSDES